MTSPSPTLLRGYLLDSPEFGKARALPDGALLVENGRITERGSFAELSKAHPDLTPHAFPEGTLPVILPGLIDVHAHLPQYPAVSRVESGLLPWLERYIFPLESEFKGEATREIIAAFFSELAANGTTCAMLYGAIWEDSCDLAFQLAEQAGLRIILGKVMMDEGSYGGSPVEEAREMSIAQTERLCEKWHGAADGLLHYSVSPRFAVTCSEKIMRAAAEIAEKHGARLQTHLSENHGEIAAVAERFPDATDYTDVYDRCGLLNERMVLGHCIHLSDREIETIAKRDARIAHCPTSNLFLNSGLIPLDRLLDAGIKVGLASDVAGGPELNMWQVMRSAIEIQKARRFADDAVRELTPAGALHLATAGAAEVLHLDDNIGVLDAGKEADLCVFDLNQVLPYGGKFPVEDSAQLDADEVAALLVYRGHPTANLETRVRGRVVS